MQVQTTGDVEGYAAAAQAFLRAEPCARNVLLTVIDTACARRPTTYTVAPSFWWITDSDSVVGAASWTPPHNLLVSSLPNEAARDLARPPLSCARPSSASGCVVSSGPADSARAVAAALTVDQRRHHRTRTPDSAQRARRARRGAGAAGRSPPRARRGRARWSRTGSRPSAPRSSTPPRPTRWRSPDNMVRSGAPRRLGRG